jgi:hypothetical protein
LGTTPAALIIAFNRPDKLKECLLAAINAGITQIYISLDAPRLDNPADAQACEECLNIVHSFQPFNGILNVRLNDTNLGCKYGPIAAINWFFSSEDFGIVIEDDVVISPEFVSFVSENQELINEGFWHINGWSMFNSNYRIVNPYVTCFPMVWGWATWRVCWEKLNLNIDAASIKLFDDSLVASNSRRMHGFKDYWSEIFRNAGTRDAWDYFWVYTIWKHNGLVIAPTHSLTRNIGFDNEATHTKNSSRLLRGSSSKIRYLSMSEEHPMPRHDLDLITGKLIYGIGVSERELILNSFRLPPAAIARVFVANSENLVKAQVFKALVWFKRLASKFVKIRSRED